LTFHLGILGSADGWYIQDLQRAAQSCGNARDLHISPLTFGTLAVAYERGERSHWSAQFASNRPKCESSDLHALLVRTMPLGSLEQVIFRMNALHVAANNGTRVINPPRSLEIAIDKWLSLETLRASGLEIPRTVCCQTREAAMHAWQEVFRGECIVKPIFGGEGRGIMRVSDPDIAWRVFSTLEQIDAVIYLQEFLPSQGFDLRLLVIDDAVFCVRRENPNDWRTNAGRGGKFFSHAPSFEQVDIAFRAAKAIDAWMVGVDVLPTVEGRNVLLEVNAVPGWRSTASALDIDIAQFLLERLMLQR
jgi:tetrahydromethanopterin:alpha-L-glutamate ligase